MSFILKEALEMMRSGEPCKVEFITLDASRKKGGELRVEPNLILSGSSHNRQQHGTITMRRANDRPVTIHRNLIMKLNGEDVI